MESGGLVDRFRSHDKLPDYSDHLRRRFDFKHPAIGEMSARRVMHCGPAIVCVCLLNGAATPNRSDNACSGFTEVKCGASSDPGKVGETRQQLGLHNKATKCECVHGHGCLSWIQHCHHP